MMKREEIREIDNCIVPIEVIPWYLGHCDIATTQTYTLNNQGKQEKTKMIVNALSDMNGLDVLMGTQNT